MASSHSSIGADPAPENRLAQETSPYLLQHRHNPVAWWPWGPDALGEAKRTGKPILLSVGYAACHWCHVMAHESFEDAATARVMNELFVNIKVDREERPDVDRVYMTFVQATAGGGGWPLNVWLTPGLKPFVGGTYFPPEDRHGQPSFMKVLHRIADAWANDRAKISELFDVGKMNDTEIKEKCIAVRPYMSGLFETWSESAMKNFTLTSVGIAIGHANIKRLVGEFANLSIWIN
jgi:uncharacterized protein YyaL (SSP411 family)